MKSLKSLPQVTGPTKILIALDYYDGPIGGFVEINKEIYHFEWDMDALEEYDTSNGPRIFALRKAPTEIQPTLRTWCQRYDELIADFQLLNNPHIYPVSDWQKARLPSAESLEKAMDELDQTMPAIDKLPITAWMEDGGFEFAGIRVIHMSKADSDYYMSWQKDVAAALRAEDQSLLDQLFNKTPPTVEDNYLFKVEVTDTKGATRAILRDYKGQPLPFDFWMTSRHSIQDLTHVK